MPLKTPQPQPKPGSKPGPKQKHILFACTQNAVRSVMAEALFKRLSCAPHYHVSSCGVIKGVLDGYAVHVMQEWDIDISAHESKSFDELEPQNFDHIISFSGEAHDYVQSWVQSWVQNSATCLYWQVAVPLVDERSREVTLASYRDVRDLILDQLTKNFGD